MESIQQSGNKVKDEAARLAEWDAALEMLTQRLTSAHESGDMGTVEDTLDELAGLHDQAMREAGFYLDDLDDETLEALGMEAA